MIPLHLEAICDGLDRPWGHHPPVEIGKEVVLIGRISGFQRMVAGDDGDREVVFVEVAMRDLKPVESNE